MRQGDNLQAVATTAKAVKQTKVQSTKKPLTPTLLAIIVAAE